MPSSKNEDKEKGNATNQNTGRLSPFCDLISEFETFPLVLRLFISLKPSSACFMSNNVLMKWESTDVNPTISWTLPLSVCLASWFHWTFEDSVQWQAGPLMSRAPLPVFSFIAFVNTRLLKIKSLSSDIQFKKYITPKINSSQSNLKVFYKH